MHNPAWVEKPDPYRVSWSKLPGELCDKARDWHIEGRRVQARLDDIGDWRIVKLNPNEPVWVGWEEVDFSR